VQIILKKIIGEVDETGQISRAVTTASTVAIPTTADWRMSTRTMPTVAGTTGRSVLWKSLNKGKWHPFKMPFF